MLNELTDKDKELIKLEIKSEVDAAAHYRASAEQSDDIKLKELFLHIASEEDGHAQELRAALKGEQNMKNASDKIEKYSHNVRPYKVDTIPSKGDFILYGSKWSAPKVFHSWDEILKETNTEKSEWIKNSNPLYELVKTKVGMQDAIGYAIISYRGDIVFETLSLDRAKEEYKKYTGKAWEGDVEMKNSSTRT